MAGNVPALLLTATWAVLTAVVYYLLVRWTGPTIVWTIAPGIARGIRDWARRAPDAQRPASSPSATGSAVAEAPPDDPVAEIVEL